MAVRVNSITAQLSKFSIGISQTSIRFYATEAVISTGKTKAEKRQREIEASKFIPHHGEKIWIFAHFLDGLTVYSHSPVLKATKALRQIPFNGKKLKPSKLRKDYWRPLAMVQFPEGYGVVGRSVFQLLRECKKFHELAWGDDMFYDKDGKPLTKLERGKKLNNQKPNTIADVAAVLGGVGKGNKMWTIVPEKVAETVTETAEDPVIAKAEDKESETDTPKESVSAKVEGEENVTENAEAEEKVEEPEPGSKTLLKVEVWWMNEQDKNYAKSWPSNVTHYLFNEAALEEFGVDDPAKAIADAEAAADAEASTESQSTPAELITEEQLRKGRDQKTSV